MSDWFPPGFDLGAFRYAAARFAKLLIRTRWKSDPGFLAPDDLQRWGLRNIAEDTYTEGELARLAADAQGRLHEQFIPRSSGGIMAVEDHSPEGRLYEAIAFLAPADGMCPWFNDDLTEAADSLASGQPVDWRTLVNWDYLPLIRDALDQLPHPVTSTSGGRKKDDSESVGEAVSTNAFHRQGRDWAIRYRDGGPYPLKDTSGAAYIHHLLRHPRQDVHSTVLAAVWDRHQRGDRSGSESHRSQPDRSLDAGPALDRTAMAQCREEFEQICCDLEEAEKNHDVVRIEQLKADRQKLGEAVAKATKPGGKPVLVGDQQRKVADRVTKAIRRTIEVLRKKDDALGTHLGSFITTGVVCRYTPEPGVAWET